MADQRRVVSIVGTRPEIIKTSPIIPLLDTGSEHVLVHTGQHYDDAMDASFFRELELREPDYRLAVGSASHGRQLAAMLIGIEEVLQAVAPDYVVVQGDTNSTLAGALAAAKLGIPVAHIEAGCRSFNRAMPEEINRVVVDHLSTRCFAPDEIAANNLAAEGIRESLVEVVGSTGIDACLRMAALIGDDQNVAASYGLAGQQFLLTTIHRAENTTADRLPGLIGALGDLARHWPVLFPVHPRTRAALNGMPMPEGVCAIEPVGYREMVSLLRSCRALLTDSGGLQEEAAVLAAPTFILREETEWMAYVEAGRHKLVGFERDQVVNKVLNSLDNEGDMQRPMGLERAGAAQRIVTSILNEPTVSERGRKEEDTWKLYNRENSTEPAREHARHVWSEDIR